MINRPLRLPEVYRNIRNARVFVILMILNFLTANFLYAQQYPESPIGLMAGQAVRPNKSSEPGLLFYLSGKRDFKADFAAGGQDLPNFLRNVKVISSGAYGSGFSAEDDQLLTYWAPGNIYAQRGTLSFFWRSRYPVGPTAFPIFRVGYADHTSWDMTWLRIDYNGSGFDAFVTDIGLARTRVSYYIDKFPGPEEWIHLALAWDETEGIRFYVNGKLAAKQSIVGNVYDTGLDQFGPHSRIISPYQVQSAYCFERGGDIDELRIYDNMLPDESIAKLAKREGAGVIKPLIRDLSERKWKDEWWTRNGWNLPNNPPPVLPSKETSIRKVEIHDAYDIKRWCWKANDGIRETTWPGVYNMSRLPGRYDYFVLPDWDCYSGSGQSIRFTLPDEKWNHVEMWGKAWGQLTFERYQRPDTTFGVRTQQQIKSYHRLKEPKQGGTIRFDNALIEEPIGSFEVYYVSKDRAPEGSVSESFTLSSVPDGFENKALEDLASFIRGRYPGDEREMMVGVKEGASNEYKQAPLPKFSLPFIHILVPYTDQPEAGLNGIEIRFPTLNVKPTHKGVFPINIRVKDPLWQMRDLADFSFSIKPGESPSLWIDTRDHILPKGRALYITIAGAGVDLTPDMLKGTRVRMVYKSKEASRTEHEIDRLTQVRDLWSHVIEEHPRSPRLNLGNRLIADCNDLLSVNPNNWLGQTYLYAITRENKPAYKIPECPDDIPKWAFLQIEYLKKIEHLVMYYINNRQIDNGEFGGGLSDDGDFTNTFPAVSFYGIEPEKILKSLRLHMAAYFDQDRPAYDASLRQRSLPLFTNGLATIKTDELHSYEDGIQVAGQLMLIAYGDPQYFEKGMETARRMTEDITRINSAGHRHFIPSYYSGTRIADESPWQFSLPSSYNVLHTSFLVALYNGNPKLQQMLVELADGLLKHFHDGVLSNEINFYTDEDRGAGGVGRTWQVFYAAYLITGDSKYLDPIRDKVTERKEFDPNRMVEDYSREIVNLGISEYINTYGSVWIDRITSFNPVVQEDRLGGIALTRIGNVIPRNFVSWKFDKPASYKSVAFYLPKAKSNNIGVIAYTLEVKPVNANLTLWNIDPGSWRVRQGIDTNNDQKMDSQITERVVELQRGDTLNLKFAPRAYKILELELVKKAEKEYSERPDLAIGPNDIKVEKDSITVRVHNLGAVNTLSSRLEIKNGIGQIIATSPIPTLEAPVDLYPKWLDINIKIPEGTDLEHGSVLLDPELKIKEITKSNNTVKW